jgi:hypothetical protein
MVHQWHNQFELGAKAHEQLGRALESQLRPRTHSDQVICPYWRMTAHTEVSQIWGDFGPDIPSAPIRKSAQLCAPNSGLRKPLPPLPISWRASYTA